MRHILLIGTIIVQNFIYSSVGAVELGTPIPNCDLTSIVNNKNVNLDNFRGKVLVVDFWASWCGPCAKSFPYFNQLSGELAKHGVEVVGVNVDENPEDAQQFLENKNVNFHLAADHAQNCAKQLQLKAMPTTFVIDRKGVVRHEQLGFRESESQEFRAVVEKLIAEP